MNRLLCLALVAFSLVPLNHSVAQETVKVFVLAGQSNMEGKAPNKLLEHQARDSKTKALFEHLRKDDQWITRDDVFIKYLGRHGGLTIGYGSRDRTGCELEFGTVLGNHFEEPVLLIKAAWGGHSLVKLFRSPSAGLPPKAALEKELEDARKRVKNQNEKRKQNKPLPTMDDITRAYGSSYRKMMEEVKTTSSSYETLFPALSGKKLEFAGFVWFQGWNDQYNGAEKEYASNLEHFIRDVRKDLAAPDLPFVIAVMGQNGSKPAKGAMLAVQEAQLAMESIPDFKGNVRAIRTDVLVDEVAETLYPEWRNRFKEWEKVGGDFAYHYLGSAIWFQRIGHALGGATLELMGEGADSDSGKDLTRGRALLQQGDFASATRVFANAVAADRNDARAWYLLGMSRHGLGEWDDAIVASERASRFPQVRGRALFNLARSRARVDDAEGAVAALTGARQNGFADRGRFLGSPDLETLRTSAEFQTLIPPLLEGDAAFVEKTRVIQELRGEAAGDQFGWVARRIGDVDADGAVDFVASAPTHDAEGKRDAGRVYAYSSKSGKLLWSRDGEATGDWFGNSVVGIGDVNGDGAGDVLVGAPARQTKRPGSAFVLSGRDGAVLHHVKGASEGESFGLMAGAAGDFNGDGCPDFAVGATKADVGDLVDAGRVVVFSGRDGAPLTKIDGTQAGGAFGSAVDGTLHGPSKLLVVGARAEGKNRTGRVHVFRHEGGEFVPHFTIEPRETSRSLGMYFVSLIGDVNADGEGDVYASDFSDVGKGRATGRVIVCSGKDGRVLHELTGRVAGEGFGTSPSQAGDADGDGHADFIVGAWQNAGGARSGGKVSLISGRTGQAMASWTCRQEQDTFGFDAQGLGDVDGDGGIDFLLTSAWSPVAGPRTGRVFVIAGPVPNR